MVVKQRLRTTTLAVLATSLLGSSPVIAQGLSVNTFQDWNFLGGGARARGMGGAFRGVADDPDAGSWNPAGLVYNEGVLLTVNYAHTSFSSDLGGSPGGTPLSLFSSDNSFSNLPSAAFVAPVTIKEHEFTLTAFYNRLQQAYAEGEFAADGHTPGTPFEQRSPIESRYAIRGNINILGGAFGTSVTDRLSIGGMIGIITGDGTENHVIDLDSTRVTSRGVDYVRWINDSDIDYGGFTAQLSAMYRADNWSVGAILSPGWTLTQNLDFRAVRITTTNQIPQMNPTNGPLYGPLDGTDREIDIPYTIGLGGSYNASDNLLIAVDYQLRPFKNSDSETGSGDSGLRYQTEPADPLSPFEAQPVGWYNLHQIRAGIEYRHEARFGVIPIRLGIRNEPYVIGEPSGAIVTYDQRLGRDQTAEFPYFIPIAAASGTGDQINPIILSMGTGIQWSQVGFDFALEFGGYDYSEAGEMFMIGRCLDCDPLVDPDVNNDEYGRRKLYRWGNYTRAFDVSRVRLFLNFTGQF